jgi:outer membrane protein
MEVKRPRPPIVRGLLAAVACTCLICLSSCEWWEEPPNVQDYIGPTTRPGTQSPGTALPAAPRPGTTQPATQPTTQPAARPTTGPATGPTTRPSSQTPGTALPGVPAGALHVTVTGAVVTSLENNVALRVERIKPVIARTFEEQERAVFDPVLSGQVQQSRAKSDFFAGRRRDSSIADGVSGLLNMEEFLPTGTTVNASLGTTETGGAFGTESDAWTTRLGASVTQALLQGAGTDVNLATLKQVTVDTLSSEYNLRGFAESLVAQTEQTYWDNVLARRQIEIFESSLELAKKQADDTRERIKVGKLAETELAAAEAEIATREEGLIDARSALATTNLLLLRLLNPPGKNPFDMQVDLESLPQVTEEPLDKVETHVAVALKMRPEMNQARLLIQRDELELVKTRNGLLPKLDLFLTLGKSGFADSFAKSYSRLGGNDYDVLVGVSASYPPRNRDAEARDSRARWSRQQSLEALANLAQLVEVDVRGAYIELLRTRQQIRATAITRKLQETTLRVETAKFDIGKSTSLLVAQAQRDLLSSQINEIQAVVGYLKALVALRRLEGSLLLYRGIVSPGRTPVDLGVKR